VSAFGDQPLVGQVAPPTRTGRSLLAAPYSNRVGSWRCWLTRPGPVVDVRAHCGTQQDADASWPENAGLPRYAVRSMGHHPR
jgi:hypothetical protein